jgi:hypothetical protein
LTGFEDVAECPVAVAAANAYMLIMQARPASLADGEVFPQFRTQDRFALLLGLLCSERRHDERQRQTG